MPLGGTFIIVYHEDPTPVLNERRALIADTLVANRVAATEINRTVLADTFQRIGADPQLLTNPDIRWLLGTFTGLIPDINLALPPTPNDEASAIIAATVANLPMVRSSPISSCPTAAVLTVAPCNMCCPHRPLA